MKKTAAEIETLSRLLDVGLDLPPEERAGWIEGLDTADDELKTRLRKLLVGNEAVASGQVTGLGSYVDSAVLGAASAAKTPVLEAGARVGPYELIREIGRGGMGTVWLARRVEGLTRRVVALKLPHAGLFHAELAQRIARERDILESLEHPNIARLYEAGISPAGQPYLALEYVDGTPITAYCGAKQLNTRERIALVQQLLGAIQYAHAQLVIHRDLKPANILVTDAGRAMLLDFGIAKLSADGGMGDTELTRIGGRALTPEYASPEQLAGKPLGAASDVYSLGVLLYELLTGKRPYTLGNAALADGAFERIAITRPSGCATDPSARRILAGDLDTILLKTLKVSLNERYPTVAALADDLDRFMRGEPVRARPDTAWYRIRMFSSRNKPAVAAVAAVITALAVGLAAALWQARAARIQARSAAAQEAFLVSIFRQNSNDQPDPAKARNTTAHELLQIGSRTVDDALKDVPDARLRVLGTLAEMQNNLEQFDDAAGLDRKRIELARDLYGRDDVRVVDPIIDLSKVLFAATAVAEREGLLREGLRILDLNRDTESRRRANLLGEFAQFYSDRDLPKAAALGDQSLQLLRAFPPSQDLIEALTLQAWILTSLRRPADAEQMYHEAIGASVRLSGPDNPRLPKFYLYLASAQTQRDHFSAAESSMRRGLSLAQRLRPESDYSTLILESGLGRILVQAGRLSEGLNHLNHAVQLVEKTREGGDPLYVPIIEEDYGRALTAVGRVEDGLQYLEGVLRTWRQYRPDSSYLMFVLEETADALIEIGEFDKAAALLDEARQLHKKTGDWGSNLNVGAASRVRLLIASDRLAQVALALEDFYFPPGLADSSLAVMKARLSRAELELARRDLPAARKLGEAVYRQLGASEQREYLAADLGRAALIVGRSMRLAGECTKAEPYLREALAAATRVYDSTSARLADAQVSLAGCLADLGRRDEARSLAAKARAIHATHRQLGVQYRRPLAALEAQLRAVSPAAR